MCVSWIHITTMLYLLKSSASVYCFDKASRSCQLKVSILYMTFLVLITFVSTNSISDTLAYWNSFFSLKGRDKSLIFMWLLGRIPCVFRERQKKHLLPTNAMDSYCTHSTLRCLMLYWNQMITPTKELVSTFHFTYLMIQCTFLIEFSN